MADDIFDATALHSLIDCVPDMPSDDDAPSVEDTGRLSAANHRLDVVTRILGGWVWETNAEHRFIYMSPSVAEFAGKPPEWHYGKTRQELGNLNVQTVAGKTWLEQLEARETFGPVDFVRYQGRKTVLMRTIGRPQFRAGEFSGYCGVAFVLPGSDPPDDVERRAEPRRRIVRAAELIIAGSSSPLSCVVLDISSSGARVRLPAEMPLPAEMRLKVQGLNLDTRCALRWRRDDEAGLEFVA